MEKLLSQYAAETGENIKVTAYYDGIELIERYDPTIDLIFLDIQMRLVNGLRAAERIRQMNERVGIIFLTTLTQYGLEGYKYQAANYIIKPLKYVRLKTELDEWIKKHCRDDSPSIVVTNDTGKYKVLQENIVCYRNMKELEQALQESGFVRCHTSYMVNLYYVKSIVKMNIELITGEVLPLSRSRRKEFMERLAAYWGDQI